MALTILLIDDEPVFRNYIRQMKFWEEGEFILAGEAGNGDEALAFLEKKEVDLVIMDVSMPGKNGVELTDILSKKYPRIAIVVVSSYDNYDYVREILKNGASDYILKSRLSEEFLILTLSHIRTQLRGRSPWDSKKELRRQAKAWLLEDGLNPFTSDNSRKAAAVIKLESHERTSLLNEDGLLEGIGKIIEAVSTESMDVLACPKGPDQVVVLTRFYDTVSEAEMRNQLECNRVVVQDSVQRIYNLRIQVFLCPFFFSDNALRTFLLHKLEESQEPAREGQVLSLTIGQYKRLLIAAEEHDGVRAEQHIKEIYEEIPPGNEALCILVTKELLELIERISVEYQMKLDFLPREFMLFQYARVKSRESLVSSIAGLYKNVLREISEKEKKDKRYSELVNRAIAYQKENFHRPISLRMIAASIGVSSSYLSRLFHEETALTVTEYLNNIRLEAAKKLLEEGHPLKDVVSRCGFRNYGYFLRVFKEYTGKTPKEYLNRGKGEIRKQ